MSALILALSVVLGQSNLLNISGTIVDSNNVPIAQADVFMEHGITGPVTAAKTNAQGEYTFQNVDPGFVSVFAIKRGYAFNGFTEYTSKLEGGVNPPIVLSTSSPLKIKISDHQKAAAVFQGFRVDDSCSLRIIRAGKTQLLQMHFTERHPAKQGRF